MWPRLTTEDNASNYLGLPSRVHVDDPLAEKMLALALTSQLRQRGISDQDPVVVLCIGTDRSTGDSLGPLVGTQLQRVQLLNTHVYGTLENPVHATNLQESIDELQRLHPGAFTIALDACLGKTESVGYISLKDGSLKPGTGVNKKLPHVGDVHLVGVVNVGGFMEYFVLQNTRLSLVYRMAEIMAGSIAAAVSHVRGVRLPIDLAARELAST